MWKKYSIKYSDLNAAKAWKLINEMKQEVEARTTLDDFRIDELDTTIALLERWIEELNKQVTETAIVSHKTAFWVEKS